MFFGKAADDGRVGNANVIGGLAAVAAFAVVVVALWPKKVASDGVGPPVGEDRARAAVRYLARETLAYWQEQAKARRLTTPAPARVSWRWAGPDVAVPVEELTGDGSPLLLLSDGLVSRLRREVYEVLPQPGRVVILGGPGAGKTAAMLLLLIDVLAHRPETDRAGGGDPEIGPVPVWLTLGGWNPDEAELLEWAATVLNRDYPGLAAYSGPGTATELLRAGRIALFLDGLDEMPDGLRGPALAEIDRVASGVRVVLTSRPEEFRAASRLHRLWNAAVIDVQPVDVEHACEFLLFQQTGARRQAWRNVTDHMRHNPDSVVAETLRTPLALSLARDTYTHTDADPADLLTHETPDSLLKHLLARLLEIAYPHRDEHARAVRWLSWIAENLNGQRDIQWWDIPAWMAARNPRLVWMSRIVFGLVAGLVFGLVFGLVLGLVDGLVFKSGVMLRVGLVGGLVFGLVAGLMAGLMFGRVNGLVGGVEAGRDKAPAVLILRSPDREQLGRMAKAGPVGGLVGGLVGLVVFGLGDVLVRRSDYELMVLVDVLLVVLLVGLVVVLGDEFGSDPGDVLSIVLVFGLVGVLGSGLLELMRFWSRPLPEAKAISPSEVHSKDLRRTVGLVLGLVFVGALVFGIFGVIVGMLEYDYERVGVLEYALVSALEFGLFGVLVGMFVGVLLLLLVFGLGPAARLAWLERISALRGRPVRFIPLLETALERQVLRQAGAVYQFRHAALQDLLASLGPTWMAGEDDESRTADRSSTARFPARQV